MTARLVAITDRTLSDARATFSRFSELGRIARPMSVVFQLRDLELGGAERMEFGRALLVAARDTGQLLVVNDRLDIALLIGADGVHLGEAGVATHDARRVLGTGAFVSRACHDPLLAAQVDADALLLSPIFESKKGLSTLGTKGLRSARDALADRGKRPLLFALGGVTAEGAHECLAEGADGVAVVGAVLRGEGPLLVRALGIER